jgi:hypothetical protein
VRQNIEIGFQAFLSDGGEEFGAVRAIAAAGRQELLIYVENAGDFVVPLDAVELVHSEKLILNCAKLDDRLRELLAMLTTPRSRVYNPSNCILERL